MLTAFFVAFFFWLGGFIFVGPVTAGAVCLGGRSEDIPKGCLFAIFWPVTVPLFLLGVFDGN